LTVAERYTFNYLAFSPSSDMETVQSTTYGSPDPAAMPPVQAAYRAPEGESSATRIASPQQRKMALFACVAIGVTTVALIPEARTIWGPMRAFIPAYQTALILAYAMTGYLMFGHYQATRSRALLYLSGGFFYTAGIVTAQFLSFPGLFLPEGRLIGGPQTAVWLWCLWHIGPVVGILLYAISAQRNGNAVDSSEGPAVALQFVAVVLGLLGLSIFAVTTLHDLLPVMDQNGDYQRITTSGVAPGIQAAIAATLVVLWRTGKFRTELNLWLSVALVALIFDDTITMVGGARQSGGWYVGRINALISAAVMLWVYVYEINRVYKKVAADARALRASNSQLTTAVGRAQLDSLTHLPRRALFMDQLRGLQAEQRRNGHALALLFIDLDGFKKVNDTKGHLIGDLVLTQAAGVLRSTIRNGDVVGRHGGDEFVIALTAPLDQIDAITSRIAADVIQGIGQLNQGIGCSIGVSQAADPYADAQELVQEADAAMYVAKRNGKNRTQIYEGHVSASPLAPQAG
jgi:diguanylate cyclase